jgi:hypothetical protein
LNHAPRIGKERPVGTDPSAVFTSFRDVVRADCDQSAIGDFELPMKLNEKLRLAPVLGAITTAAEDEYHWMLSLQLGELSALRCMVGKLIVGEDSPGNDVRPHVTFLLYSRPAAHDFWL